ncbi:MAG: hypothetical protein ACOCRO_07455 [Halanaerobiales bacterium]
MDFKFLSKEDRENIKRINQCLGMKHRLKPYDFNKKEDLIEACSFITAEYIDFAHYWRTLANVNESFDESLEYFYPAAWAKIGLEGSTNDNDLDEAMVCLRDTTEILGKLMDKAEDRCKNIWTYILFNDSEEVIEYFFKEDFSFNKDIVETVLEEKLFEVFLETDYTLSIEEVTKDFARNLCEQLKITK